MARIVRAIAPWPIWVAIAELDMVLPWRVLWIRIVSSGRREGQKKRGTHGYRRRRNGHDAFGVFHVWRDDHIAHLGHYDVKSVLESL